MPPVNSHIIPRHHLKQFTNDAGCIFTYPNPDKHLDAQCKSKGGGRVVNNTASEIGYYSSRIEKVLDKKFEYPGSRIAQKILDKQEITSDERNFFAEYLASFIYRVPRTEKHIHDLASETIEEWKSVEHFMQFRSQSNVPPFSEAEYFEILNDLNWKDKVSRKIWENMIETEHQQIYEALLSREWWVAEVIGDEYFITSDNPLFYSITSGLADRNIQITFPLSKKMAMVFDGNRAPSVNFNVKYCPASQLLHKQVYLINKRTADNSTQLYSPKRDVCVQKLLESRVRNTEYIRRGV